MQGMPRKRQHLARVQPALPAGQPGQLKRRRELDGGEQRGEEDRPAGNGREGEGSPAPLSKAGYPDQCREGHSDAGDERRLGVAGQQLQGEKGRQDQPGPQRGAPVGRWRIGQQRGQGNEAPRQPGQPL